MMDLTQSIIPKSDQAEQWRAVPGYEGYYEVSDLGRVRSLDRLNRDGHRRRGRMMRLTPHPRGYPLVNLWRDNTQRMHLVHRLVLGAFVGPAPDGTEARHLDGDAGNAALVNLIWGTHSENEFDKVEHGTHWNASKTHCPSGHAYDDENTYIQPGNPRHRSCLTCIREYNRRVRETRNRKAS